jgi:hypothetical protein
VYRVSGASSISASGQVLCRRGCFAAKLDCNELYTIHHTLISDTSQADCDLAANNTTSCLRVFPVADQSSSRGDHRALKIIDLAKLLARRARLQAHGVVDPVTRRWVPRALHGCNSAHTTSEFRRGMALYGTVGLRSGLPWIVRDHRFGVEKGDPHAGPGFDVI